VNLHAREGQTAGDSRFLEHVETGGHRATVTGLDVWRLVPEGAWFEFLDSLLLLSI